jgi:gas vesicle protein
MGHQLYHVCRGRHHPRAIGYRNYRRPLELYQGAIRLKTLKTTNINNQTKMENSKNSFGQVLTALLAGAAIGAVAGMLFAPEEGTKTRKKIAKKAKKMADSLQSTAHNVKEKIVDGANQLRNQTNHYGEKADERAQDMAHSVKQTADAFKK